MDLGVGVKGLEGLGFRVRPQLRADSRNLPFLISCTHATRTGYIQWCFGGGFQKLVAFSKLCIP